MTTYSKKSMPIWTTKVEIAVIEFYREHSFLWDPKNKMYYNRDAREMALQDLADSLGCDEAGRPFNSNDVKDKFKNMRAVYGREQVKVDQTLKWGADDVYEPKWLHFPRMQEFLFNVFKPRAVTGVGKDGAVGLVSATNSRSSYSTTMEEDEDQEGAGGGGGGGGPPEEEEEEEQEPEMEDGDERTGMPTHEITYTDDGYYESRLIQHRHEEEDDNAPLVLSDTPSPHLMVMHGGPHKKARCSRKQRAASPIGGAIVVGSDGGSISNGGGDGRYLVEALKMMREERDKRQDPEESFCGSVAGTLRRLSPYNRERAKMEIQKLLFQIEFGEKQTDKSNVTK